MKLIHFKNNDLHTRYDTDLGGDLHGNVVPGPNIVEVSDELFMRTCLENDGRWSLIKGEVIKIMPTAEEQKELARAVSNQKIEEKIHALEAVQHTALRNAVLGKPGAHEALQTLDDKVTELRAQIAQQEDL